MIINCTPTESRFWKHVDRSKIGNCWLWVGSKTHFGYGQLYNHKDKRHPHRAHRLSWEIHYGDIPDGLQVLHKCDNPGCVNPEHLFLGNQKDNVRDAIRKGRAVKGNSKLDNELADNIRKDYMIVKSQRKLAKIYGVHQSLICLVLNNKIWNKETSNWKVVKASDT
jgi:hypothetical protein